MAKRKITVTIDEDQLARVQALVESGPISSVSAFVQHAVRVSLANDDQLDAMVDEILDATGGR